MKVLKDFFCTKERKKYKRGDEYTGSRTDINHLLEQPKKEDKRRKRKIEKK